MLKINYHISLILALLKISLICSGQTSRSLLKVTSQTQIYNSYFPKQKIYLHTDKDTYFKDEKIWFRGYVNSGVDWKLDTLSKNLYIELWSPSGIRVNIIRLKLKNGMASGLFPLSDTLEQGIYQLRAFTDMLLNYSPEFYFNKNLKIFNSNHTYLISPEEARKNNKKLKEYNKLKSEFDVSLTFEQKSFVENIPARIYYQAVNPYGDFVPVEGYITSSKSGEVVSFKNNYAGLGEIIYTPSAKESYKVNFISEFGTERKYPLPDAVKTGLTGNIYKKKDSLKIELFKPNLLSNDPSANRYFIIGYANTAIYYTGVVDLRSDTVFYISASKFPEGIIGFSVFSNRLELVSEYQVYNSIKTVHHYDLRSLFSSDSVKLTLQNNSNTVKSLSIAVTVADSETIPTNNFISNYYINSDRSGNPDLIVNSDIIDNDAYLQMLVKTSKIAHPDWEKAFSDLKESDAYTPENGIVIQGRIITEILSIPLKDASIKLEILDRYNDMYSTKSNDKGLFGFEGFDFYDTLNMKIIARKRSGRKNLLIELLNQPSPAIQEYYGSNFLTTTSLRDNQAYRREMGRISKEQYRKEDLELEEFYKQVIHGRPDYILYGDELSENQTVMQAIVGRVPGVQVTDNRIIIRGINTLMGSTDPLVLVDDVPTDVSILQNIYVRDVDRIEFLKGPSTAIYGVRGANGVIAVYTKRGEFMIKGQIEFGLVGYQRPDNFLKGMFNQTALTSDNLPETKLWIPSLNSSDLKSFELNFKKPSKGKYIHIDMEGVDNTEKPFSEYIIIPVE